MRLTANSYNVTAPAAGLAQVAPSVVDKMKQARLANHAAQQTGEVRIQHTTFMLAGQAVGTSTRTYSNGAITYYYLFGDHLGSASTMTTTGGSVVEQARFLPFGEQRPWSITSPPQTCAAVL